MLENTKLIVCAAVIALSIPLAACGGGDVQSEIRTTTVGQELADLKKAQESGAINQAEYEKQRQMILNRK